jgi:LytS/YehU family sensor histidine kinase
VSEEALEKKIVPVTLQILMENAVKHNIASAQKPLHIRVFDSNGFLSVANNVQRKTIVEESNKQGLQRLVQLYSYLSEHPILIAEVNGVFCVKIPLLS